VLGACSGGDADQNDGDSAAIAPVPTVASVPDPTPAPTATPSPSPTPTPTPTPTPIPVVHPCTGGVALGFPCENVGLEALLSIGDLGGGPSDQLSDIWGWTDPVTEAEIAIVLGTFGTAFVDVTSPGEATVVGVLPLPETVTRVILQRDVKVHRDHAYIVSESVGHGLQIFDLATLRDVRGPERFLLETTSRWPNVDTSHNIAINEATGFAYLVGSDQCEGGPVIVDLAVPTSPVEAGCFPDQGYSHDIQCVSYAGPAADFTGRELCFGSNEDTLAISDVTDKTAVVSLSEVTYPGVGYAHQGWLTEDQRYFVLDDEADEGQFGHGTRTRVFDVADPTAPVFVGYYEAAVSAADHNLFIVGDLVYMANYRSGLRIARIVDPAQADFVDVGFFDTYPADDAPDFLGAFSSYPFFRSDTVVVSSRQEGLFVLRPDVTPSPRPTG
jgi:choice-of-anchor B domain-containing protein